MKFILHVYLALVALGTFAQSKKLQDKKPNIIYILTDDLGIGDVSFYNENSKISTPNIDKMGAEGMKFTDAHTSSSVCTPTRYSIMTGRYNWRTPLKSFVLWGDSPMLIKDNRLTVAQLLKNNGYQTACIGKWHLGLNWSMKDGSKEFDYFSDVDDRLDVDKIDFSKPLKKGALNVGFDYSYMISASLNMPPFVYIENDKVVEQPDGVSEKKRTKDGYSTWIKGPISNDFDHEQVLPVFVKKAQAYIQEKAKEEKPFFLYLPLAAPHNPILPIAPWAGRSNINPYADFVVMIDDLMGDLFKTIKDSGIAENTIIIFTSDNGCAANANIGVLKEKGHNPSYIYSGIKGSILEGGHRVPFLVKWPKGIKANTVSNETICTADFMATCADLVNYKLKDNEAEDSYSLIPLFNQKNGFKREETIHHDKAGLFAIRKGDWKLVVEPVADKSDSDKKKKSKSYSTSFENILYNLKNDSKETKNVAIENPKLVEELRTLLIKQIVEGRSTPGKIQKNDTISFTWDQAAFALNLSTKN
ncbi:sulfatase family protein [Flavobacterium algicola]|uniref:sulfatase family protein n=1 Tax=Flavobacterium algicola TaxID=556529 RepID=UPI001EFDAB18|nr:arylsulfatase [Flavobacterium algicola]MCG9792341.1 arylsulfatase [Flavobacterium algicola]